jgi:hypothetical protein
MTNAVIFNRLYQLLLDMVLSDYVFKLHLVQNSKIYTIKNQDKVNASVP